ncbi:BQ5605_C022g09581 [Microbotryum silenes-dioicae]|uniref:BQ5605_C022g09581 protein n=1 Tax=Microbotryum silenes-dioicae TaxID=796604 RepID=A0A2X0ML36_9BASI|nr:BQ5605_C022g09581 [Microbotryum silenes-dioicae]
MTVQAALPQESPSIGAPNADPAATEAVDAATDGAVSTTASPSSGFRLDLDLGKQTESDAIAPRVRRGAPDWSGPVVSASTTHSAELMKRIDPETLLTLKIESSNGTSERSKAFQVRVVAMHEAHQNDKNMLEDQVAAPQVEAQFAALQARTDELVKVEETFEADNQETIIKAVEECVAGAGPRPSDAAAVDEVDRTQVAEVKGGSTCCGVIQDFRNSARRTRRRPSACNIYRRRCWNAFDRRRQCRAKKRFGEQLAKQQTTTRLSAERAQAQPDAKAATEAAIATATATATTSSAPAFAPKVDVDALFVGKLKELEAGRLASQQQAVQAAVTEALARQATGNDAHVATQLQETRNNMPGRVHQKGHTDDGVQEGGRDQAQGVRRLAQRSRTNFSRRTGGSFA